MRVSFQAIKKQNSYAINYGPVLIDNNPSICLSADHQNRFISKRERENTNKNALLTNLRPLRCTYTYIVDLNLPKVLVSYAITEKS